MTDRGLQFLPFESLFQTHRVYARGDKLRQQHLRLRHCDWEDPNSYYAFRMDEIARRNEGGYLSRAARCLVEQCWYSQRRPYFNVYSTIQKKFDNLTQDIELEHIVPPFHAIEIRTAEYSLLFGSLDWIYNEAKEANEDVDVSATDYLPLIIHQIDRSGSKPKYFPNVHDTLLYRKQKLSDLLSKDFAVGTDRHVTASGGKKIGLDLDQEEVVKSGLTREVFASVFRTIIGVCLIYQDKTLIDPVLLKRDQGKKNLTEEELAKYVRRAAARTGQMGFDVGKQLEGANVSEHFRNGTLARYYVGPEHPLYPPQGSTRLRPVIMWRSSTVVKPGNLPEVPTGFRDQESEANAETNV